jgi:hypothetical protein
LPELLWQIILKIFEPKIIRLKIIMSKGAILARSEFADAGRMNCCRIDLGVK